MTRRRHHKSRWRSVYIWHRYLGLGTAAVIVFLAATGLLLNHTDRLGLDERPVSAAWLLDWYGMEPRSAPVSYALGNGRWITWLDGRLFLDGRQVARDAAPIKGGAAIRSGFVLVEGDGLRVLDESGATVEKIPSAALPGRVDAIAGGPDGRPILATRRGNFLYEDGSAQAEPYAEEADWVRPAAAPAPVTQAVLAAYRGDGLSLERVLLDLHSGRLFGHWGPLAMDAAAVLFFILAGTGIVNWARSRRRTRR